MLDKMQVLITAAGQRVFFGSFGHDALCASLLAFGSVALAQLLMWTHGCLKGMALSPPRSAPANISPV